MVGGHHHVEGLGADRDETGADLQRRRQPRGLRGARGRRQDAGGGRGVPIAATASSSAEQQVGAAGGEQDDTGGGDGGERAPGSAPRRRRRRPVQLIKARHGI